MRGRGCEGLAMSRTWRRSPCPPLDWFSDRANVILMASSIGILVAGFIAALLIVFLASPAHAQPAATNEQVTIVNTSTVSGAGSCSGGGCVGTGVAQIKSNTRRRTLTIDNTGNAVAVGFCFGVCTASIGTGGTQYLAAGTVAFWPNGSAPGGAITFISASVTPPVTVREGL